MDKRMKDERRKQQDNMQRNQSLSSTKKISPLRVNSRTHAISTYLWVRPCA